MKIQKITKIEMLARGVIVSDKVRRWTHVDYKACALTSVLDDFRKDLPEAEARMGVTEAAEQLLNINSVIHYINLTHTFELSMWSTYKPHFSSNWRK
jgi:hypothetical protein